ncbi:MAG: PilZ domain-containing protein [Candidatus Omnitrophota bacterium]|nr:PilZ domain-containing protein [Candidatus Omnitrophota bacterium]MBU1929490.1 PilZ domain-containing protein [Candidatus Omnitrophota bacterium]MBU2034951.1 PilZ domain-containing protein [Candidatus Omnitrophota bacterium]MBU2221712.1 PilZ domain-containing protein [Candidatus Omnitrophota bacterium]MBU2258894.1 PilZ domain-containing protein [Candidatus Omnitrophota bacterium]
MHIEDRRKNKRAYMRLKVECRGKNYWQYVDAMDVSSGGMFISTDQVEPLETKLEVMFEFGDQAKKLVKADAVVAWVRDKAITDKNGNVVRPAGMGLKFIKISPLTAKDSIDQLAIKFSKESNSG